MVASASSSESRIACKLGEDLRVQRGHTGIHLPRPCKGREERKRDLKWYPNGDSRQLLLFGRRKDLILNLLLIFREIDGRADELRHIVVGWL